MFTKNIYSKIVKISTKQVKCQIHVLSKFLDCCGTVQVWIKRYIIDKNVFLNVGD